MRQTVMYEKGRSTVSERAYGHTPDSAGVFRLTDQSLTSSTLGDGGIYSSVEDLFRWHRALSTNALIPAATTEEAFTPHITSDDGKTRYGYGWMTDQLEGYTTREHGGSTIGFRNHVIRIPDRDIVVIILMNRADGNAGKLARQLAKIALKWKP
jgi:CubicO group peptidase (beta-lactamase class C family)